MPDATPPTPPPATPANPPQSPPAASQPRMTTIQPPRRDDAPPRSQHSQPVSSAKPVIFAIEIAGPKNETVMCPLDNHPCRGRWTRKNLIGVTYDGVFSQMPDLPGLVFVVNAPKRRVRRFDPLGQPENKRLLDRARRVTSELLKERNEPERTRTWEDCDDDFLKTFCFWVYKLVKCDRAVLVEGSGELPTLESIRAMPGLVNAFNFDSSATINRQIPNDKLKYRGPEKDDPTGFESADEMPEPIVNAGGEFDDSDSDYGAGMDD